MAKESINGNQRKTSIIEMAKAKRKKENNGE
jgi:hypothetical protein